jgi:serine/threonine-protein kinase
VAGTTGATPLPLAPGTEFSRYAIDSRLAGGGMAEIWRARVKGPAGFERRIVIKTMQPQLQRRTDLVDMFVGEAAVAARLSHPNIVHVFDFGLLEGRYFMAMEYVPGVTLRFANKRAQARGERLPLPTVLHVMIDLCEALHHLHEQRDDGGNMGLIHRDLSPDNVVLSTSGAAKLIDFGAARATARTPPTPIFVGKYRYAAPERIRHQGEDRRADVYSAGIILYEALAGARPFEGTDADVINAITSGAVCDPRARVPDLPAAVAEVVMRATAHDRADRFASAHELGAALGACLVGLGGTFDKERDVTAALAALLDEPRAVVEPEAVPEPVATLNSEDFGPPEPPSGADAALCEVEILEASGPIWPSPAPPPIPRAAPPPSRPTVVWQPAPDRPERERSPVQRAVELFDRGLELRAAGHHGAALDAWERALRLAPDNRVYQSNVKRLREQLNAVRARERR